MRKSNVRNNLTIFIPDIAATFAQGIGYVLGETNSYACHGTPGVSNTAGAAIWTLDYALFASTLGIQRIFFHDGIGFKYNLVSSIMLHLIVLQLFPRFNPLHLRDLLSTAQPFLSPYLLTSSRNIIQLSSQLKLSDNQAIRK